MILFIYIADFLWRLIYYTLPWIFLVGSIIFPVLYLSRKERFNLFLGIYLSLFFSFWGILFFCPKIVFQSGVFPGAYRYFSPANLYERLSRVMLEPGKRNYSFPIRHKYKGNYYIAFVFDEAYWQRLPVKIHIKIKDGDRMLYENHLENPELGWYDYSAGPSGIPLIFYSVPKHLSFNKIFTVDISIEGDLPPDLESQLKSGFESGFIVGRHKDDIYPFPMFTSSRFNIG